MEGNSRPYFANTNPVARFLMWIGKNRDKPFYFRYGLPLVLVVVATLIKINFTNSIGINSPFLVYFAVVCFSVILGGVAPAIMAAIMCAILANYFFMKPYSAISIDFNTADKTLAFLLECGWLILLSYGITSAHKRVQQNQLLFKAMIEKGTEGILLTNREGKRIYCSPSVEKVLGYTAAEFLKLHRGDLTDPADFEVLDRNIAEVIANPGMHIEFTLHIKHKNGSWIWLKILSTNLLDDKAVHAIVTNFSDITDRIMLEQQKDDFISIASHELKTPITSLKTSIQLLDKMKENPSTVIFKKLIDQCNRSMNKISILVEDLLNASRVNQGQLHLNKKSFKLSDMLAICCNHVRIGGHYNLVLQGDKDIEVDADETRIDQVVVNFVNNAVKYAPGSKEIYLIIEKLGDEAKVSVKDSGPGIAPEKLPYLFDRYYRTDHAGIQYSGLGLGLYISSEIIKRHGGDIGVNSEMGKGSTFWFTLPLN